MALENPLVIIGLDGATFDILDPLCIRDELPHLKFLMESGIRTELNSTNPPVTLPAWTSFLTASNPSEHGITDMFMPVLNTYDLNPFHGSMRNIPTFLSRFSDMGYRCTSIGVPGTFPPEKINGICISGFDSVAATQAGINSVYPKEFYSELKQLGGFQYATFNEHNPSSKRMNIALNKLLKDIAKKEELILNIYQRENWDIFFVHLQASDTAGHHLWHTFDPNSPRARKIEPLKDALPSIYRSLDSLIGNLMRLIPQNARILIVSDHGMGGASDIAIYLNRWLQENGFLNFQNKIQQNIHHKTQDILQKILGNVSPNLIKNLLYTLPQAIRSPIFNTLKKSSINYETSMAFSYEIDCSPSIWINKRDSFVKGFLSSSDASELVNRIAEKLLDIKHPKTKESLIQNVHLKNNSQDRYKSIPDIIIEPAWPGGYRPSFLRSSGEGDTIRFLKENELHAPKGFGMPGVHKKEGIFLAHGLGIKPLEIPPIDIKDAGAIIYTLAGLPIPPDISPPPSFLIESIVNKEKTDNIKISKKILPKKSPKTMRRLKDLGYID